MKRFSLLAASLAAVMLAVMVTPAGADHAWGPYHWTRSSTAQVSVPLHNYLDAAWTPVLTNSGTGDVADDWTASSVVDTPVTRKAASAKACNKPTAGVVEVCNGRYGNNGWLGIAQIWISNTHITQGVVKLNDFYFAYNAYNTPEARKHVLCQEVGHTLGLDHQHDVDNTCMNDEGWTLHLASAVHPNIHDYDQLAAMYAHNHASGSSTSAAPAGNGNGNGRGQSSVYVEDRGNHRVVTFVLWA